MSLVQQIIRVIKQKFGYTKVLLSSNSKNHTIKITMPGTGNERSTLLGKLFKFLTKYKVPIERKLTSNRSKSSGHLKIENIYIITKPDSGSTELLNISARKLLAKGKPENQKILGKKDIKVLSFSNPDTLRGSVLEALETNPHVRGGILKTFNSFFKSAGRTPHIIDWHPTVTDQEKNELGKYIGEVIPGVIGFFKNGLNRVFSVNPVKTPLSKFLVPDDNKFPGIDAILVDQFGKPLVISNKYGAGAAASFFSNILPNLLDETKIPSGTISKFVNRMKTKNIQPENSMGAIYEFGIRDILKISSKDISDPLEVYKNLTERHYTSETRYLVKKIKTMTDNPTILKYLNSENGFSSITYYFTSEISELFNADLAGTNLIKSIISGKNFWQANLNTGAWKHGTIKYNVMPTKNVKIVFLGKKSAPNDITSKQGKLNYFIRPE